MQSHPSELPEYRSQVTIRFRTIMQGACREPKEDSRKDLNGNGSKGTGHE